MGQTEVRKAMTYMESKKGLKKLSAEYTEDSLHRRFSMMIDKLSGELQEYTTLSEELERADEDTDWSSTDTEKPLLAQKILAERASLKHMRETAQKKYDSAMMYETWLNEYGNEFAQLYRIKDYHEKCGYDEELEIREIDITDNGDVLTNDKYNKMNAYAPEPLTELVLHVKLKEDEESEEENPEEPFGFNFGVMEFNQPNMPPQVKVQLSFDDETLENLNEAKLKRVFAFCDTHGIPVSDLQIRRFDGSVAEDLIREKIEQFLEKAQIELENKNKLENKKEKAKEEARYQELEAERQKLLASGKVQNPDELSWDDISTDVVPEHRVMKAMAPMARDFVRQNEPIREKSNISMTERQYGGNDDTVTTTVDAPSINNISDAIRIMSNSEIPPVQTISKGVAAPEVVPTKEMTREIIETAKEAARTASANTETAAYQEMPVAESAPKTARQAVEQKPVNTAAVPQPENSPVFRESDGEMYMQSAQQPAVPAPSGTYARQQAGAQVPPPPQMPKLTMSEVEKGFEKLIEKGWGKRNKLSYFKAHTGWFKTGWTEYIIYDTEDKNNRKKDGVKQKDGSVKYTYTFKLFLKMESDGLHFTYRTPNHRKMDPDTIADIVGKLKDLGYTHINFPAGITNAEKGMWRKAMAENGIIPMNLSLTVKHARSMIDDMKKTEKFSPQEIAEYGYKLALEMQRCDAKDGKTPNITRKTFIEGLINTKQYFAFTNAYSLKLKSKIEGMLRKQDTYTGSPDKFAAYLTLRKVFDIYTEALEYGNSLLHAPGLSASERQQISRLGLGGPVQKLRPEQLEQVFDILYPRQQKMEYDKFKKMLWEKAYASAADYGPRLAPNVVFGNELDFTRGEAKGIASELKKLGVEDFQPFEDTKLRFEFDRFNQVDLPEFRRQNTPPQNSAATNTNTNTNTSTSARQAAQEVELDTSHYIRAQAPGKKKAIVRRIRKDDGENRVPAKEVKMEKRGDLPQNSKSASNEPATVVGLQPDTQTKVNVSKVVANTKSGNAL